MSFREYLSVDTRIRDLLPRWPRWSQKIVARCADYIFGISSFIRWVSPYEDCPFDSSTIHGMMSDVGVQYQIKTKERLSSLRRRSLIIVANHPVGVLDTLALYGSALKEHSETYLLASEGGVKATPARWDEKWISVDTERRRMKKADLKKMSQICQTDANILIFPSGTVARFREHEWQQLFIRLALKYKRAIMPVYIEGSISKLLKYSYVISKEFSRMLILGDVFRMSSKQKKVDVYLGNPIEYEEYGKLNMSKEELVVWFRKKTLKIKDECE